VATDELEVEEEAGVVKALSIPPVIDEEMAGEGSYSKSILISFY